MKTYFNASKLLEMAEWKYKDTLLNAVLYAPFLPDPSAHRVDQLLDFDLFDTCEDEDDTKTMYQDEDNTSQIIPTVMSCHLVANFATNNLRKAIKNGYFIDRLTIRGWGGALPVFPFIKW